MRGISPVFDRLEVGEIEIAGLHVAVGKRFLKLMSHAGFHTYADTGDVVKSDILIGNRRIQGLIIAAPQAICDCAHTVCLQ